MEFKVKCSKQQQLKTYLKSWTPEPPVCVCKTEENPIS